MLYMHCFVYYIASSVSFSSYVEVLLLLVSLARLRSMWYTYPNLQCASYVITMETRTRGARDWRRVCIVRSMDGNLVMRS